MKSTQKKTQYSLGQEQDPIRYSTQDTDDINFKIRLINFPHKRSRTKILPPTKHLHTFALKTSTRTCIYIYENTFHYSRYSIVYIKSIQT